MAEGAEKRKGQPLNGTTGACYVPCLQSHSGLLKECQSLGIKFEASQDGGKVLGPDVFEVEDIVDDSIVQKKQWFLVKWKGWSSEHNTWEPIDHLKGCRVLLEDYMCKKKKMQLKGPADPLDEFLRDVLDPKSNDLGTLLKMKGLRPSQFLKTEKNIRALKKELKTILCDGTSKRFKAMHKDDWMVKKLKIGHVFSSNAKLLEYRARRKLVLEKISLWEEDLNSHSGETTPIVIENDVDLEGPPECFTYIVNYKLENGIIIHSESFLVGCDCVDCYASRKECCEVHASNCFAYSKYGTLRINPGEPIYECNIRCKCGPDCLNRVVQHGRKINVSIFRTEDERGWGVKTLQKIKKGTFVMEYVGEVISNEEAERRGARYDSEGRTYLFDLDFDMDSVYTVDAAHYGNVAHFINHSCDPNLSVYAVWINNLDTRLPRLAFFAKRDIKCNEELTFDYKMKGENTSVRGTPQNSPSRSPASPRFQHFIVENGDHDVEIGSALPKKKRRIHCKCGAETCRGYLF